MRLHLTRHWLALSIFALVNALDILTTHIALAAGLQEGNPLPSLLLASHGEAGMVAIRVLGMCAFLAVICWLQSRMRANPWRAVGALNVVMLAVVLSNTVQIV